MYATVVAMKFSDNPIRLARIAAGVSQVQLAEQAGISRSSLVAIEDGRAQEPRPETMQAIARVLGKSPATLGTELAAWNARRRESLEHLSESGHRVLRLTPAQVDERFDTFAQWRAELAPTPTAFATLLGISHMIPTEYERGIRSTPGLPPSLQTAMLSTLKVSPEYLRVLSTKTPS